MTQPHANGTRRELSVIAPCFNEADNLKELAARALRVFDTKGIDGELVLVDDASTDATAEIIRGLEREHPGRVLGVFHDRNQGIEGGWRSGLRESRGAYVCLIDADLQNQPEDVYRLYREIKFSNVDVVQGVRSHIGRLKDGRYTLSLGLNRLLNWSFGMRARDNKSGFVLCRREVLDEILRHRYRYHYFQTFITVAAHARGYSIREVETIFEQRIYGKSFIRQRFPYRVVFGCLLDIARAVREYRLDHYRDLLIEQFVHNRVPKNSPPPVLRGLRRLYFQLYMRLMPFHHWMITRNAGYYYDILDRSQWLPPDAVRELQEAKLRRLIHHAYWHVPYYREILDREGIRPEEIRTLGDLERLPLLSKQDVRDNLYFDLMSDSHRKQDVYRITTSGSTGQPLVAWADRHQLELRWAATLRSQEWTGYRFGDRTVRLWHQTIGMDRKQVLKEKLDAMFSRRKFVPAFELDPEGIRAMGKLIRRHRPTFIDGYAESFHYLARHGLDPELSRLHIRGLMSSAQTLDPESRDVIERAFGARVFDKYGSREFSGIAYECDQHQGHHVVSESYHVEILVNDRPARPGELGEVVVTDLTNYVMPFIRYRIGDLAYAVDNARPCDCGRGMPRIGAIEGRVQSTVVGTNGVALPGAFFAHLLKDYGYAFERFQVEQPALGELVFRYVPAPRFHQRVLDEVFAEFHRYLGSEMKMRGEAVDKIEMVRTGKHQAVINRVQLNYQEFDRVIDPRTARSKQG